MCASHPCLQSHVSFQHSSRDARVCARAGDGLLQAHGWPGGGQVPRCVKRASSSANAAPAVSPTPLPPAAWSTPAGHGPPQLYQVRQCEHTHVSTKHLASSHRPTQRHVVTGPCCMHEQDAEATPAVRPSPRMATLALRAVRQVCMQSRLGPQSLEAKASSALLRSSGASGRTSATFFIAAFSSALPDSRNAPTTWPPGCLVGGTFRFRLTLTLPCALVTHAHGQWATLHRCAQTGSTALRARSRLEPYGRRPHLPHCCTVLLHGPLMPGARRLGARLAVLHPVRAELALVLVAKEDGRALVHAIELPHTPHSLT
jgi:hypothetical protein